MSASEQLEDLNNRFIEIYEATRCNLTENQQKTALIVINGEDMLFFHGDREPQVITGIRPPLYARLRVLGHVPLAIYCLLTLEADAPALSSDTLVNVAAYRKHLESCGAALDIRDYVERGDLPRPVTIYERSLSFLDAVLKRESTSGAELDDFAGNMADDIQLLFAAAAKAQIDAVHERVLRLKQNVLSRQEWRNLRVVVMGAHMAHKEDLFLQYFSHILHTPQYTEKRLIYFEGEELDGALDLLGTVLIDFRAARAFFKDENRLHRDIFADVTRRYLHELGHHEDLRHPASGR